MALGRIYADVQFDEKQMTQKWVFIKNCEHERLDSTHIFQFDIFKKGQKTRILRMQKNKIFTDRGAAHVYKDVYKIKVTQLFLSYLKKDNRSPQKVVQWPSQWWL